MPFEGAGAVSSWQVSLPRTIRAFDYSTISDVLLHLGYTAEEDEGLREAVGQQSQKFRDVHDFDPPAVDPPLDEIRAFDADVLATTTNPGISGEVTGRYVLKFTAAGPFQTPPAKGGGPIDSGKLRDIVIRLGYHVT
jgi:hypothetical protein